ncbi:wax ester/triacylglycerol synthase domain-containing protein [Nocardia sp. NPDC059246]|uniref:wax ester/triacylglycerol synthase domain-containing protein n=1 Tax=unclassified Nocardia TaxID=2637762 RepID=UPI00368AE2C5
MEIRNKSVDTLWEELARWGTERELNSLDSLMWRTERPPADSWAGVVVKVLGSAPSWQRLRRSHQWALNVVPRFTERVVDPIVPLGPPLWSRYPEFDLSDHLTHVQLGTSGTMAQVLKIAQELAVTPLDPSRPPWRAIFVDGLEDGRAAYILQAHHVLMDGGAATQLFSRLLSPTLDPTTQPTSQGIERRVVTPTGAALYGLRRLLAGIPWLVPALIKALVHLVRRPKRTARYVASLARVATPPPATTSPILSRSHRHAWRFGTLECQLTDIKQAGKSAGGTVNDAFVAAILGGLRIYHERLGLELDDVPISMPVSVRKPDDPLGGNRFTGAFYSAPSSIIDPAKRIQAMRERVSMVRNEPALDFLNTVTPAFNYIPRRLVTSMIGKLSTGAALTTSSWPGAQRPVQIAGADFERMFVFGPLPGTAMCAALCTHGDVCCIAVNADGDVFTDLPALWTSLQQGLDEVLALATR